MRVLHFKRTRLAWAPEALAVALGRYSGIESRVVQRREDLPTGRDARATLVHFHNQYVPYEGPSLLHVHSPPGDPGLMLPQDRADDPWLPGYRMVLAQYHATLPEFREFHIVRNVVDFDSPEYRVRPARRFRVAFSPWSLGAPPPHPLRRHARRLKNSIFPERRKPRRDWADKGVPEVTTVLAALKSKYPDRFEFDLINGVPLSESLTRKAASAIVIDDLKSGAGYHRSGLEGLALSKITLAWTTPEVEQVLLKASGAPSSPFLNCSIGELEPVLEDMLLHSSTEELIERGRAGREWMETYWHPEVICREYVEHYRRALEGYRMAEVCNFSRTSPVS